MFAKETANPSRICPLSLALFSSNSVRLETTVLLWAIKISNRSFRLRSFGVLFTKATLFTPKALSRGVREYKLFKITSGFCPDLISITILTPSLSDSSLISDIPSTLLSLAS